MTLYWITLSLRCLGLFGILQKRGFTESNGLDTTCRHPTENPLLVMTYFRNVAKQLNNLYLYLCQAEPDIQLKIRDFET